MKMTRINWIKKYIKLFISYGKYYELFDKTKDFDFSRAILIGSPVHNNLGDHLIAVESLKFIKSLGFKSLIEIPEFVYELFPNKITIYPTDTIFITGGGWMGDLYEDEIVVEDIIARWSDNRIIILPQTIYFSGDGVSSIKQLKSVLQKAKDIMICVRERSSYEICRYHMDLNLCDISLLPDMGLLALKDITLNKHKYRKKILLSLRTDIEKIDYLECINEMISILIKNGYSCENTSTVIKQKVLKFKKREEVIQKKIAEFSEADLVITDRLHSMVFALLAGTLCVVLDNITHKVIGVSNEWLSSYPGLYVIENPKDINYNELLHFLNTPSLPKSINFMPKFDSLVDRIKRGIVSGSC
jgi:exopolysaccharide biosynthesis predicted pyruvyltransferase EpsI